MIRPSWLIQQLIPPALITYLVWCWRLTAFEVGPALGAGAGSVWLGHAYSLLASLLIGCVLILYLRLYFLPANQSVPPRDPPTAIIDRSVVFECLSPAETTLVQSSPTPSPDQPPGKPQGSGSVEPAEPRLPLVDRCYKDKCNGRWKPARARHCSECGVCRGGFDHHCALVRSFFFRDHHWHLKLTSQFANCLTVPYVPLFLLTLILTPIGVSLLSAPLLPALMRRALTAWHFARHDGEISENWWDWPWAWVIAGGPVGRYVGGVLIGWKALDLVDGGGLVRLEIGVLVGIGWMLSGITAVRRASGRAEIKAHPAGSCDRDDHSDPARSTHGGSRTSQISRPDPRSGRTTCRPRERHSADPPRQPGEVG